MVGVNPSNGPIHPDALEGRGDVRHGGQPHTTNGHASLPANPDQISRERSEMTITFATRSPLFAETPPVTVDAGPASCSSCVVRLVEQAFDLRHAVEGGGGVGGLGDEVEG